LTTTPALPLDDEAEGQRGHAEVDALHAQRWQADHHAHGCRQQACADDGDGERNASVHHDGFGVRSHPQKCRVSQGKQAGEASQQHQAQAHDGVNEHEGELGQPVFLDHPRCRQQEQQQQAVPEHVPAMLGQLDVLVVVGLENKAHVR
jgi:hypothetical protein